MPMESRRQLEAVAAAYDSVEARASALDALVPDALWQRRPSPDAWSVAECIAHLNLSSAAMLPRMQAAAEEARRLGPMGTRAYRGAWFGRLLARMVGPVPVVLGVRLGRVRTAAPFVPDAALPRATVMAEFRRWQAEERRHLAAVEDVPIDRTTLESPFVPGARYDGYSALWIVVRHELRHLEQAKRAFEALQRG